MYYCEVHQIAFHASRQFHFHWTTIHKDEPRPKSEQVYIEQVPEGATIAPPPKESRRQAVTPHSPVTPSDNPAPVNPVYVEEDELATKLDEALAGIGATPSQRQGIMNGFRILPRLRESPYHLFTFITARVGPNLRGQVPWAVDVVFPDGQQNAPDPPYFQRTPAYPMPSPIFWPEQARWPGQRPWEMNPSFQGYPPNYQQGPPGPGNAAVSPEIVELQKKFDGLLELYQAERAERAKEKQERDQKERDAALQAQINAVAGKVDSSMLEISGVVKQLSEQIQKGYTEGETSRTQQLAEKVASLTETIADQREAHLQGTVDGLREQIATLGQKINTEPTGKTTEDLLSQGIPLGVAELRNMGNAVVGELKGIREQAADGKLPSLSPPVAPNAKDQLGAADPVRAAQQIAGAREIENKILALVAGEPRS